MIGIAGEEARRFTDSTKRTGSDCKSKLLGRLICRRGVLYIAALGHTILSSRQNPLWKRGLDGTSAASYFSNQGYCSRARAIWSSVLGTLALKSSRMQRNVSTRSAI